MTTARTSVIAREGVLVETVAIDQLRRAAALPGCLKAVGMPDIHPGPGIPIGTVFAFERRIHPSLIGSDAGCGVRVVPLSCKIPSVDRMERRLRRAFAEFVLPDTESRNLGPAAWSQGIAGLSEIQGVPDAMCTLALAEANDVRLPPSAPHPPADLDSAGASLGSIGGGNHFAEIGRVTSVVDSEAAGRMELRRGSHVLLVHSGSRGLGHVLAQSWGSESIDEVDAVECASQIAGTVRFAQTNRFLIAYRMLSALGVRNDETVKNALDLVHNDLRRMVLAGKQIWLHRKGAAPAEEGQLTVVLGSRGMASWLMRGTGSERGLLSVAHGAGRRMSRAQARERFRLTHTRRSLMRTSLGGRVLADDTTILFEEHPGAYKPIGPVVDSLVDAGLATPVAAIEPVLTVKQ